MVTKTCKTESLKMLKMLNRFSGFMSSWVYDLLLQTTQQLVTCFDPSFLPTEFSPKSKLRLHRHRCHGSRGWSAEWLPTGSDILQILRAPTFHRFHCQFPAWGSQSFFGGELKRDVCLQLFTYVRIEQNGCSHNESLVDADVDMLLKQTTLPILSPNFSS